ncbi:MAG: nitroreductase family protein [Planctomycetota bacterium]
MDAMQAIFTRRSIRNYIADKPVPDETVETLLKAAMAAPTAGNVQPWRFIVIRNREILENDIPRLHPNASFAKYASVAVLICGDTTNEQYAGYWVQDCSAAMENLLLAAHALGLGACWCGVHPREQRVAGFRALLDIPDGWTPLGVATIGYTDRKKDASEKYNPSYVRFV